MQPKAADLSGAHGQEPIAAAVEPADAPAVRPAAVGAAERGAARASRTGWLAAGTRSRRLVVALAVYVVATAVYFGCARRERLVEHTPFNHYALLADAWLHHRLDLGHAPPAYTQNNDFAELHGKWFVSFPWFPAVLLLPVVKFAGSPENVRDGQFFLWLAGLAPAVLFLALEKLRRTDRGGRSEVVNLLLTALFAFGTVYFFTAEQGTVWFAAHVVGSALACLYLLFALDAERPVLAGLALGLAYVTRPDLLLACILFGMEALRTSSRGELPSSGTALERVRAVLRDLDFAKLAAKVALFSLPIVAVLGIEAWHNYARFGTVREVGHTLLTVGWRGRIERWGLFSYHYLPRNLGIVLANLPYLNQVPHRVQINTHGLALWVTTPAYLWLLWPRRTGWLYGSLAASAGAVFLMLLCYQNSGWLQFGYRFSNDFAPFLIAMLAVGGFRFGKLFWTAAVWAVAVNAFGAVTFDRDERFYYTDASQRTIFQPD